MNVRRFPGNGLMMAVVVAVAVLIAGPGLCNAPKTVAVFPFTMNSPQDLGFLQNGLFSMLSSRLADPGKVEVLDRETVEQIMARAQGAELTKGAMTEAKARMIGAEAGVDYILFGSLTHFGESVSLDANMVDVTGEKKTLSFFEQSNSMGDVIPLVNSFAGDINEKVFNRRINNDLYAQPEPQETPAPGAFHHAGGAAVYGGGMMAMQSSGGFTTHLKFDDVIRAMAVGPIKNDGIQRVVTATDSNLHIYLLQGSQLVLEETLEYDRTNRIVALDVADINNNGFPEIFVTSLTIHLDGLQSFIVEYDGNQYQTLMEGEFYYFRVMHPDQGQAILMAQNKGRSPFDGRIYNMMPRGNVFEEEKRIRTPRNSSVLSMAKGSVSAKEAEEYIMLNKHGRLVMANESGADIWESTSGYGGVANHWLMPRNDTDASYRDMVYLMPRVKLHDVNKDCAMDVIVIQNKEVGGGAFGRYKRYKEGYIETLTWNGIGLSPAFQTAPLQGWLSDFAIADIDGDNVPELIVSVVSRSKIAILGKDKGSNIISFKLE